MSNQQDMLHTTTAATANMHAFGMFGYCLAAVSIVTSVSLSHFGMTIEMGNGTGGSSWGSALVVLLSAFVLLGVPIAATRRAWRHDHALCASMIASQVEFVFALACMYGTHVVGALLGLSGWWAVLPIVMLWPGFAVGERIGVKASVAALKRWAK